MKKVTTGLQALHLIEIRVVRPTEKREPQVKLIDWRFDTTKTIPWNFTHENALGVALAWLKEQKVKVYGFGLSREHYFVTLKPIEGKFAPFGQHLSRE